MSHTVEQRINFLKESIEWYEYGPHDYVNINDIPYYVRGFVQQNIDNSITDQKEQGNYGIANDLQKIREGEIDIDTRLSNFELICELAITDATWIWDWEILLEQDKEELEELTKHQAAASEL